VAESRGPVWPRDEGVSKDGDSSASVYTVPDRAWHV